MNNFKIVLIILTASIAFLFITFLIIGVWFTDDAFISFRYANNLVNDLGLVFNENEKVQGYTNFLWVILLAGLKYYHFDFVYTSIAINILSYLILIIIFFLVAKKVFINSTEQIILSTLLFASSPNLLIWSVGGGLEGPLFALLCFSSLSLLFAGRTKRNIILSAILILLATLTRPEGIIFFFFGIFYYLLEDGIYKSKKNLIISLSVFVVLLFPYVLWCLWYYNDVIPNTYYAKVTFDLAQIREGLRYSYRFFMSISHISLFLFIAYFLFRQLPKFTRYTQMIFFFFLGYIIIIGGDFMFSYRFFIPIMPFIVFIVTESVKNHFPRLNENIVKKRVTNFSLVMIIFICFNLASISFLHKYEIKNYKMIENGKQTALYLNHKYSKNYKIAVSAIGTLGYYSEMIIIDLLGLTNKIIAQSKALEHQDYLISHNRSNPNYVLALRPDIIMFGMPPGEKDPVRVAELEIKNSKKFKEDYSFIEEKTAGGFVIRYYILKK